MFGQTMDLPLLVSNMLQHAAQWHTNTEVVARTIDGGIHRSTYGQTHARCRQLANALTALGVVEGDVLGSLAWNTHQHFELFYGVSGMGAVLHTINPRLFEPDLVYIADHAGDRFIFCDAATLPLAESIDARLPKLEGWIFMGPDASVPQTRLRSVRSYEALLRDQRPDFVWPEFDEKRASTICYTSGTTGRPKGVVYSNRAATIGAMTMSMADFIGGYKPGSLEVVMPIAPLFHGNGWQMVYTAPIMGQKLVLPGRNFEPDKLAELIIGEGVTIAAAVPTVWLTLLDYVDSKSLKLDSLRAALVAGSRAPDVLLQRLERDHGVMASQCWGMTEGLGVGRPSLPPGIEQRSPEEISAVKRRQGRITFGTQFRLRDDEGRELPFDGKAAGHLSMRGYFVSGRYLKQEEAGDGWLHTGDIARVHPDGTLELVDRSKDVIKSGGEWISTMDLESHAMHHPDVALAAAIAIPHEKWQERPLLVVTCKPGRSITKDAMLEHLRPRLATWWLPDDVVQVAEMPLTGTGKVNKLRVREMLKQTGVLPGA